MTGRCLSRDLIQSGGKSCGTARGGGGGGEMRLPCNLEVTRQCVNSAWPHRAHLIHKDHTHTHTHTLLHGIARVVELKRSRRSWCRANGFSALQKPPGAASIPVWAVWPNNIGLLGLIKVACDAWPTPISSQLWTAFKTHTWPTQILFRTLAWKLHLRIIRVRGAI